MDMVRQQSQSQGQGQSAGSMAPQKLASSSVRRHKSRPAVLSAFRDNITLVAFRYEKTVQAEPPIPLPPHPARPARNPERNPRRDPQRRPQNPRATRPTSTVSSSNGDSVFSQPSYSSAYPSTASSTPTRASPTAFASPIVVAPPTEQHPALRGQYFAPSQERRRAATTTTANTASTRSVAATVAETDKHDGKRDSGLAPTTSSATNRGEDDDHRHHQDVLFIYDKLLASGYTFEEHALSSSPSSSPVTPVSHASTTAQPVASAPLATHAGYETSPASSFLDDSSSPCLAAQSGSPRTSDTYSPSLSPSAGGTASAGFVSPTDSSRPVATARKLAKSLSLQSGLSGNRLRRKKSSSANTDTPSTVGPMPPSPRLNGAPSRGPLGAHATHAKRAPNPPNRSPEGPNDQVPASAGAPTTVSDTLVNIDANTDRDFSPLSVAIPSDSFIDNDFLTNLTFSKRGSVMFGGRRAASQPTSTPNTMADNAVANTTTNPGPHPNTESLAATPNHHDPGATAAPATTSQKTNAITVPTETPTAPAASSSLEPLPAAVAKVCSSGRKGNASTNETTADRPSQTTTATPSIRVMSADVEKESQKVRSLYESGESFGVEDGGRLPPLGEQREPRPEAPGGETENDPSASPLSTRPGSAVRRDHERAGGIEDWEDVHDGDVDRYGFITPRRPESRIGTPTELKSAQYAPRRRNVLTKRDPSGNLTASRSPSRKVSARSLHTQNSEISALSRRSTRSAIRQASNYLPHNRNRRWMDEAGEMLTMAPGLQDIMEDEKVEKISDAIKKKEAERSEKWRKMAKVVKKGKDGEGMEFEFDVKNPKLIERTWKGIPDRWRASAWYSFLATSAKNHNGSATEEQIMASFRRFQDMGSPDDVQIDLDVPRTINRHIMFRKRYRGGQRLLFRVLHALSLYFPDVGYVQGMASLAATLLCYFDEEKCFVMLVRMWQQRGLEQLYEPGFEGLMTALKDLETQWLGGKEVAKKLSELCIDPTAYGTRWYLTLFNLSIPFQAQLRVWDVFLLLGDAPPERPVSSQKKEKDGSVVPSQLAGIEVIHATSAALINALGEVLLDSDFENAMKALTSWIPIKDEDMLMKITKAEWKANQGKKKA